MKAYTVPLVQASNSQLSR